MKYERAAIVSHLHETSRSEKEGALLSPSEGSAEVYDLDKVKDLFCSSYRHNKKLKSCDAYYCDQYNQLVMEFKNTHHRKLQSFFDEIEIKIIDTHMLLAETFNRHKKSTEMSKELNLLVVYNDILTCNQGLGTIDNALNKMKPKRGSTVRNVTPPKLFADDTEFLEAVGETKNKYEGRFYKEIEFIEKKEFIRRYGQGYFGRLSRGAEIGL